MATKYHLPAVLIPSENYITRECDICNSYMQLTKGDVYLTHTEYMKFANGKTTHKKTYTHNYHFQCWKTSSYMGDDDKITLKLLI